MSIGSIISFAVLILLVAYSIEKYRKLNFLWLYAYTGAITTFLIVALAVSVTLFKTDATWATDILSTYFVDQIKTSILEFLIFTPLGKVLSSIS